MPLHPSCLTSHKKHMPDLLADIKNGHNEVYEKRHQRIEEKKGPFFWCRNKQSRKLSNLTNSNPK